MAKVVYSLIGIYHHGLVGMDHGLAAMVDGLAAMDRRHQRHWRMGSGFVLGLPRSGLLGNST